GKAASVPTTGISVAGWAGMTVCICLGSCVEARCAVHDFLGCSLRAFPTLDLHPLTFLEILVVLKKVADLTTNFFRHVVGCTQLAVSGVKLVDRNGQKLGVTAGLVFHLQHTQSTAGYDGTHLNRERRHHEDINGVTVIRQSLGDVAVVAWVMHGGQHESIDK